MMPAMSLPLVIRATTTAETGERSSAVPLMDEHEFRAFYERTARPLWAYLARITGSRQEADDVLQEAYYRFYRAGARHEDEAHRRNSLFRIATNLVRDAARRASKRRDVPLEEAGDPDRVATVHPPAPERRAAARTDLARAMRQLDPAQRQMLWLAYAQGASHQEIAEILGLRPVSIRTLLLRARRKAAAILAGGARNETREERP